MNDKNDDAKNHASDYLQFNLRRRNTVSNEWYNVSIQDNTINKYHKEISSSNDHNKDNKSDDYYLTKSNNDKINNNKITDISSHDDDNDQHHKTNTFFNDNTLFAPSPLNTATFNWASTNNPKQRSILPSGIHNQGKKLD